MRTLVYKAVRLAPKGAVTAMTFFASIWAALDKDAFLRYLANLDVSRTGAMLALIIAGWVALCWLTRTWNVTDRQLYEADLRKWLAAHSSCHHQARFAQTDEEFVAAKQIFDAKAAATAIWITVHMGQAALVKYMGGAPQELRYPWDGEHSGQYNNERNKMLCLLDLRIKNLEALIASGHWDHPIPLSKRKRTKEWKALKMAQDELLKNG